jgi:ABC-type antimicrobial peptide transport system permease subunit
LVASRHRLAQLHEVENTYLSIFGMLGGLALVLGAGGVGIVLLRNVLERQGELALLKAVGFGHRTLLGMIVREHFMLLGCGLLGGVLSALWFFLAGRMLADAPWSTIALAGGGILLVGLACVYLAARWTLSRPLLEALRKE